MHLAVENNVRPRRSMVQLMRRDNLILDALGVDGNGFLSCGHFVNAQVLNHEGILLVKPHFKAVLLVNWPSEIVCPELLLTTAYRCEKRIVKLIDIVLEVQ